MKQIEKIAAGANFNAVSVGKSDELNDYVMELGSGVKIPGKVFGGTAVQATGSEFSFQSFMPGTESGFLHIHRNHEELYFFLSGRANSRWTGRSSRIRRECRAGCPGRKALGTQQRHPAARHALRAVQKRHFHRRRCRRRHHTAGTCSVVISPTRIWEGPRDCGPFASFAIRSSPFPERTDSGETAITPIPLR